VPARLAARRARSRYTRWWRASALCSPWNNSHSGAPMAAQCREPLAGARLDEGAAYHEIDFAMRLGSRDQPAQALGVAAGRQTLRLYTQAADEPGDLLVMPQFLARQPRHLIGELQVFRVRKHQSEGGRGRLLFAVGVIDEQHLRDAQAARIQSAGVATRSKGCAKGGGAWFTPLL
jgi:hypothetical protein